VKVRENPCSSTRTSRFPWWFPSKPMSAPPVGAAAVNALTGNDSGRGLWRSATPCTRWRAGAPGGVHRGHLAYPEGVGVDQTVFRVD